MFRVGITLVSSFSQGLLYCMIAIRFLVTLEGLKEMKKDVRVEWERKAGSWVGMVANGKYPPEQCVFSVIKKILSREDLRDKKVLDAGCGEGRYGQYMKERGAIVTGVDFSTGLVKLAAGKLDKVLEGDVRNLPFENESFDVVTCFMVLMLLPNTDCRRTFEEFHRVLKNSGKLIFSTVHPCFENWGIGQGFPFQDADDYFQVSEKHWTFHLTDGSVEEATYFHRPLEDYFKAMEGLFVVRRLWEPKCSKGLPKGKYAHVEFLIVEGAKV